MVWLAAVPCYCCWGWNDAKEEGVRVRDSSLIFRWWTSIGVRLIVPKVPLPARTSRKKIVIGTGRIGNNPSARISSDTSVSIQKKRDRTPSTTRNLPTRISSTKTSGCNRTSNPWLREPCVSLMAVPNSWHQLKSFGLSYVEFCFQATKFAKILLFLLVNY